MSCRIESSQARSFHLMAGFAQQQAVAELAARILLGFAPVHAAGHQMPDPLVDMKSDFLVEFGIEPAGAKHIGET